MQKLCEQHPPINKEVLLFWGGKTFIAKREFDYEEVLDLLHCEDKNTGMKFTIDLNVPFVNPAICWTVKND